MKQSPNNSNTQEDDVDEFFGNQSSDEEGEERLYYGYQHHQQKQQQENDDDTTTIQVSRCSLSQHECQSQRQHFHKLGYHEAYDVYKDDNLQVGFEDGLMENMDHAFKIGQLLGMNTYVFSTAARQQKQRIGQLDPSEQGRSASNQNNMNAAFLVREFLEKEQVKDGSTCDKNNQELDMLTQNLEEIIKLKS